MIARRMLQSFTDGRASQVDAFLNEQLGETIGGVGDVDFGEGLGARSRRTRSRNRHLNQEEESVALVF
jgi:hypothetical protein